MEAQSQEDSEDPEEEEEHTAPSLADVNHVGEDGSAVEGAAHVSVIDNSIDGLSGKERFQSTDDNDPDSSSELIPPTPVPETIRGWVTVTLPLLPTVHPLLKHLPQWSTL